MGFLEGLTGKGTPMKKQLAKFAMCALTVAMLAGCAGGGGAAKGPSDEEIINAIVADFKTAFTAGDVDKVMSYYADEFKSDQGMDKAAYGTFLKDAKEQGFLDGIEINIVDTKVTIDGEKAKVGPVEAEGSFGLLTLSMDLEKRDGTWVVVYQAQQ